MNKNTQNLAIAQALGWQSPFQNEWLREFQPSGEDLWAFCGTHPEEGRMPLPAYTEDLGAIHRAIKAHDADIQFAVFAEMAALVDPKCPAAFADAATCCKALLVTLGRWEGETK